MNPPMNSPINQKQRAAEAAMQYVRSDTVIGLGTGSTADYFLIAIGEALRTSRLKNVRGVPTSEQTARRARELNIPLIDLADVNGPLDVTVDGADEVAPNLDLVKGLGGALLREKIVAQNTDTLIIVADAGKRVDRIGTKAPVPVEVIQYAHPATARFLASLGCEPKLRVNKSDGQPFITDNGNVVYDCRFANGIDDPRALQARLRDRAGVAETGLFPGMAKIALICTEDGSVQTLKR
jgi:ribose 5-phosphate isomerase A